LLVSLPLLLGGCGEKGVNEKELEEHEGGIVYLKDSETLYTGKAFALHKNGQKERERIFKDGKRDGLSQAWHLNGQKELEANFKSGKKDGLGVIWYENGQKKLEGNWKDDKQDGLLTTWHENGQKRFEVNYKNGKKISGKYWNSKGEPVDSWEEADK
tara:strand:- start:756 stop:1226 length:471 start_codon:yes stop_codon:yes gene_type:complete